MTGMLLCCLLAANPHLPPGTVEYPYGAISDQTYSLEEKHHGATTCYHPEVGDLIISSEDNLFWKVCYTVALTGRPCHAGIVVQICDGRLGVLEGGYSKTPRTRVLELSEWRRQFQGVSWIRKRRTPITQEQSRRLTEFAYLVADQPFNLAKLAGQMTPLRARGPIRTYFMGKPRGPGHGYFCAELVMEALVYSGLQPAATTRPAATYPRDMFFDSSMNPYINKHLRLERDWQAPRWWTCGYLVASP